MKEISSHYFDDGFSWFNFAINCILRKLAFTFYWGLVPMITVSFSTQMFSSGRRLITLFESLNRRLDSGE